MNGGMDRVDMPRRDPDAEGNADRKSHGFGLTEREADDIEFASARPDIGEDQHRRPVPMRSIAPTRAKCAVMKTSHPAR